MDSWKVYVKVVNICNNWGLWDMFQLSKRLIYVKDQIVPNTGSITESQDLFIIFVLFKIIKKTFLDYWIDIFTKRFFFKKSSKTNCGLDFMAPVNILPPL